MGSMGKASPRRGHRREHEMKQERESCGGRINKTSLDSNKVMTKVKRVRAREQHRGWCVFTPEDTPWHTVITEADVRNSQTCKNLSEPN